MKGQGALGTFTTERTRRLPVNDPVDDLSADLPVDIVAKKIWKMSRTVSLAAQVALETQLMNINQAGIADLANGTRWRIAHWDLPLARKWPIGANVTLGPNDPGRLWAFKMTNAAKDEQVAVGRAARKPVKRVGEI